jgi:hypothetical protein
MPERKKVAALVSTYFSGSHADVIVTKFLKGFPTDDGLMTPRVEVASMYIDQVTDRGDIGRDLAAEFDVPVYPSILKALTLGADELAVDGVLLIGEHGDYAWNEKQQQLFPRKFFMEQICGVMAVNGRAAPIFNDKHLSYNWHDAKWMVDRAAAVGAPFMAGSSMPVAWRQPWLEHERGAELHEAVAVGFSGLDIYGFHALEMLQCMVERRRGAETGIAAVTCLEGDDVWRAGDEGRWSRPLVEAACATIEQKEAGRMEEHCKEPAAFLLEYRDGLRASVLMLNGYIRELAYAARCGGEVEATNFYVPSHDGGEGPYAHFSYLSLNIEEMFLTGRPSVPVERTLLTSGALEAALTSRHEGHRRLETPWMDVTYQACDKVVWRPTEPKPTGQSLVPFDKS